MKRLVLAAAIVLSANAAQASINGVFELRGATRLYTGAEVTYVVSTTGTFGEFVQVVVDLRSDMQLLSVNMVEHVGGAVTGIFPGLAEPCSGPPYTCVPSAVFAGTDMDYEFTISGASGQTITIATPSSSNYSWGYDAEIRVRVGSGAACPALPATVNPSAFFDSSTIDETYTPPYCAVLDTLVGMVATVAPSPLARAATQQSAAWSWQVVTSGSGPAGIPPLGIVSTSCSTPSQCSGGTAIASLTTSGPLGQQVTMTALNVPANPPLGDQLVPLKVDHANQILDVAGISITERPVTSLLINVVPNQPNIVGDQPVDLNVATATNAFGGFEPRTATFALDPITAPPGAGPPQWDPTSWLQATGSGSATLTVPQAAIDLLRGRPAFALRVVATHANPTGGPTTAEIVLTVTPAPGDDCVLLADETQLRPGQSTGLQALVVGAAGVTTPLAGLTAGSWRLEPEPGNAPPDAAWLTVDAVDAATAQFAAPPTATAVRVVVTAPAATCSQAELSVVLQVALDTCTLIADRQQLHGGEVAQLSAVMVAPGGGQTLLPGLAEADWSVEPVAGEEPSPSWLSVDAGTPALATFAPTPTSGAFRIAVAAPATCSASSLSVVLLVTDRRRVEVRMAARPARLLAGEPLVFEISAANVGDDPITGLTLRMAAGATTRLVGGLPRGSGAARLRPVAGSFAAAALDTGAQLDLAAGESVQLTQVALAAQRCGRSTAELVATDANGTLVTAASAEVEVLCDPELSEATLFGKVFADRNGDNEQGGDEPGLPGVTIVTAAGVGVTTDARGLYSLPRLRPGRTAVKIDPATLPVGATVLPRQTQLVSLTPGMFAPVDFAVHLPSLSERADLTQVAGRSFGFAADGRAVLRLTFAVDASHRLTAEAPGGPRVVGTAVGPHIQLELPVGKATQHWQLAEVSPDGRTWLWLLSTYTYDRGSQGSLIVPSGPHFLGALRLPPATPVRRARLPIEAELADGVQVAVGDGACVLTSKNRQCVVEVREPLQRLALNVDAAAVGPGEDPPPQTLALTVDVQPDEHLLVALAGVEVGRVLDDSRSAAESPLGWDARGQFFYRGRIAGKYLLTAGADIERSVFVDEEGKRRGGGAIAQELLGHDPRRVFRDLDPEAYYPVYGDSSVVFDEREAGGRFFVRLEVGDDYVKWGSFNTGVDDVEVGRYTRALHGLAARWSGGEAADTLQAGAAVFAARSESRAATDELWVTGGSLYWLAKSPVVEGSVRVVLEALDEVALLPVRTVQLSEGADFEVDHAGGRVYLDPALAQRYFGSSLTGRQGARARLLVSYEFLPSASEALDADAGVRAVLRVGPATLAVNALAELPDNGNGIKVERPTYALAGGQLRLDLGEPLRLRVELAHSESDGRQMARSTDGGLTFHAAPVQRRAGEGAALELASKLGLLEGRVYGRYLEPGFTDGHWAAGNQLTQAGGRFELSFDDAEVFLQHDYRWRRSGTTPRRIAATSLAGGSLRLGSWRLGLEGRHVYDPDAAAQRLVAGGLVGFRINDDLELYVRRRQVVLDDMPLERSAVAVSDTALGARAAVADAFDLSVEAGLDDRVRPFAEARANVPLDADSELYVGVARGSLLGEAFADEAQVDRAVAGGRRRVDGGVSLYAENALLLGDEPRATRSVGATVGSAGGAVVGVRYERGEVDVEASRPDRISDSGAVTLTYLPGPLRLRLGGDVRHEGGGALANLVWGVVGRVEWDATDDLTAALAVRGSTAYALAERPTIVGASWEGAVGVALRPRAWNTLNVFGRYAIEHDRGVPATGALGLPGVSLWSHRAALMVVWALPWQLSLRPKVAYRLSHVRLAEGKVEDAAVLPALRAQWQFASDWDVGAEVRGCGDPVRRDWRVGGLAEVGVLVLEWLHLGAGYNLSDMDASAVVCREPGVRGVFVRAEAVY